jgi:DNA ligase (NAD+)
MDKKEAKLRIVKLKEVIDHHRYLYHVLDKQEVSEQALDSLKHELYLLEQQYPDLITSDSPTQRVAGKPLKGFKEVEHRLPMLSIEDIFSEKELLEWEGYLKRLAPDAKFEYFCELKIDGFAIALIYKNGLFDLGATRGNGKIGEDVTQNLRTIESIPLKLNADIQGEVEVRGEVYIEKKDFNSLNKELAKTGQKPYANPRNLAAGSIRQLDPKLAALRPLRFLAYDLITDLGQKKHSKEHEKLLSLGFRVETGKVCQNISQVIDFWKAIGQKREALPFQIDGVVIVVNNNDLFLKLGVAGKSPRGIRAFKFSPKQATTKVKDIKLQVGRTGAITPVAILEPVNIAGATISRATLHNEGEIKRLGLKIGDTVIVERAGDVIPAISQVLPELREGKEKEFIFPKVCPVCGTRLVKSDEEAVWRCPNANCRALRKEFFYHFVSKKAFDIEGLGPKVVDRLIEENLLFTPADIFSLTKDDLLTLERFAERSAQKLINSIQKSKKIPLARFVYSLGIRHIGEEMAYDLSQYFGSLERLIRASREELGSVPGAGKIVLESLFDWLGREANQKLIKDLLKSGVIITLPEKIGRKLSNQTFIITGSLSSLTRSEAHKKIRMLGGRPQSSISKETDYLIAGENPGSKFAKAKTLGVKIISEKEFLKMLGE